MKVDKNDVLRYGIGGILSVVSFKVLKALLQHKYSAEKLTCDTASIERDQVLYQQLLKLQRICVQHDDVGFYRLVQAVDKLCTMAFHAQQNAIAERKDRVTAMFAFSDIRNHIDRLNKTMRLSTNNKCPAHPRDVVQVEMLCRMVLRSCLLHFQSIFHLSE